MLVFQGQTGARAETRGPSRSAAGSVQGRCHRGGRHVKWDAQQSSPPGGFSHSFSGSSSGSCSLLSGRPSTPISFISSSIANGACSTIVSKTLRVMLCKTRELKDSGRGPAVRRAGAREAKRRAHRPTAWPLLGLGHGDTREQQLPKHSPPKAQCRRGQRRGPGPLTPSSGQRFCRRAR